MLLQVQLKQCEKHVFIMNGAPTPKGFTVTEGFAKNIDDVGIQNIHILNPAGV